MSEVNQTKKLGVASLVMMIFSIIFGFTNPTIAFLKLGYSSIIWYVFSAVTFFLPLIFIVAEFAVSFKNDASGGIYTWMSRSRGDLYGFVGTFMWYFVIIVWITGVAARIWVPISSLLFAEDKTKTWNLFGLGSTKTLAIFGILLVIGVTFMATRGFNKVSMIAKIGGLSCTAINILLYITSTLILVLNKGYFEEPIKGVETFFKSPNPNDTIITLFGFITFSVFAFGGIETLASLVDKAKSAKTFSKACMVGGVVIAIGYSTAIFFWGITANYKEMNTQAHLGNVLFIFMRNLGYKLGLALGMPIEAASNLGSIFMRIVGVSIFFSFLGALFTIVYSPLKTLFDGSPKGLWPENFTKKNAANMPQNAMWIQAVIVCLILGVTPFLGDAMATFFDILQLLTNVAQSLAFIFIIAAFPAFRKNENLNHDFKIFKTNGLAYFVTTISLLVLAFATIFTIIEPTLKGEVGGLSKTMIMIIGPVVFFIIALLIFKSYKNRETHI